MVDKSGWTVLTESNPNHSAWYIKRFDDLEAEGADLHGEARFVDALVPRDSRILDAGCGPGRIGARLAELGHEVVGVDVDPELIAEAKRSRPGPEWLVGDLSELDLVQIAAGDDETTIDPRSRRTFDLIVSGGNVMTFLAPSTRTAVLTNFKQHLAEDGRVAIGFGAGRGYEFDDFFQDVDAVGLTVDQLLSTWDVRPFSDDSGFLVALLR